ncbi:MAG TPA: HAD family hydrolase [Bryobacteraceae bacterium]|nr:HAD family hydrolase [Bryobacteraceae bacterium]
MPSRALVLFDIDGTLIRRAGPHHRQALVDAVRLVTGLQTTTDHIPVHGMLDPDILTRMLLDAGAREPLIRRRMPEIIRRAQTIYVRRCPDLQRKTCPGVRRILYSLKRKAVPTGLVTGNLTRIGWKKMERAALRHYFRFGIFAEMAHNRSALLEMAIRHAHDRGWIEANARVTLIGDAPSDIIAAHENRARVVAVHTGISTREELAALAPDLLLEDLRSLRIADLV